MMISNQTNSYVYKVSEKVPIYQATQNEMSRLKQRFMKQAKKKFNDAVDNL